MGQRHSEYARIAGDHYATPAWVTEALLSAERFDSPVWEPAAGEGHMAMVIGREHLVVATDLARDGINFLEIETPGYAAAIITNPPFALAESFCRHALHLMGNNDGKVAMLLPHAFDAAKTWRDLFEAEPFKCKLTLTTRIRWANLVQKRNGPSSNHAWYVWDWTHTGNATMGWLP